MHGIRCLAVVVPLLALIGCQGSIGTPGASAGAGEGSRSIPRSPDGGFVVPEEICGDGDDDDLDGTVDEGCACTIGATQSCWPAAAERRSVGACSDGVQRCEGAGEFGAWSACTGAVLPSVEIPGNGVDEDCDGGDSGDACVPREFGERCDVSGDEDCDGAADCEDSECDCPAPGCAPSEFAAETASCGDGMDQDCDGLVDCLDPDCFGKVCRDDGAVCSGEGAGLCDFPGGGDGGGDVCADLFSGCTSDGCRCVPGTRRYCHVVGPCVWGEQTCLPAGTWGPCESTWSRPSGCEGAFMYDVYCCVRAGGCCDNQNEDYTLYDPSLATHASVGSCGSVCAP